MKAAVTLIVQYPTPMILTPQKWSKQKMSTKQSHQWSNNHQWSRKVLSVKQKQSIKQQPSTLIPTMRKSSKMQSFRCGNWKFNHSDKKTANKTELSTRMKLYSDFISVKRRKLNRYHWDRQNLCCRFSVINLRESHFSYLAQGLHKMIAFWPLDCTIVQSHLSFRSPHILNHYALHAPLGCFT